MSRVIKLKWLSTIREKLRGLTPGEASGEILLHLKRRAYRRYRLAVDRPESTYIPDAELKAALGGKLPSDILDSLRGDRFPHLTEGIAGLQRTAEVINKLFPDSADQVRREADGILAHRITLFERELELGTQIDWHTDPVGGARWSADHYSRVPLVLKPGSDVRVVWELNRLHHLVTLGRAYVLSGDERFTDEFISQLLSWTEQNPPRFGVNWTVAMEVAIRAINLIAALGLFRRSPRLEEEVIGLILKLLIAHGRFIRANLEFSYRAPSNHYLSNLIGLFVIGATMPDLGEAREWRETGASGLLVEMDRQVLVDGVDYEGAVGYHRLVVEAFTLMAELGRRTGVKLPPWWLERLRAMYRFVRHYLKPDGTAPLIGDSDDGRIVKFSRRPAIDHSYLMPLAAVLFEEPEFKLGQIDEEALWWFGARALGVFGQLAAGDEPGSRAFRQAQIFIAREAEFYSIFDCGDHGARGRGSHAHSDALSFEVFAYGRTLLRDPGTFAYTSSEADRNLFRSTAYHNTVRVDGKDISTVREGHLFSLGRNVQPRVYEWESRDEFDRLRASHFGYWEGSSPVEHTRMAEFHKQEGYWVISDLFTGEGEHLFEFFFNFDSGLEVATEHRGRAIARGAQAGLAIVPVSNLGWEIVKSGRWVSLAYGTRTPASAIIYRLQTRVPVESRMLLIPFAAGDEARVEAIISLESSVTRPS